MRSRLTVFLALVTLVAAPRAFAQQVVRYEPAEKDLKFVYATVPPVAGFRRVILSFSSTLSRPPVCGSTQ